MEVTKQFYQLLEEFQSSGQPYIREELLSELIKVKALINKLEVLNISESESRSLPNLSPNPKKNAPHCMTELVKGCKEAENSLNLLYLFALNHTIDEMNVAKFLETYFNGIFKTKTFNLVSFKPQEKSQVAKVFCQINKQFLSESAKDTVAKEIAEQFANSHSESWAKIDLGATTILKTFFEDFYIDQGEQSHTPIEEIYAIKFPTNDSEEVMILTDCPKNIMLEKFLDYDLMRKFPNLSQVIKDALDKVFFPEAYENNHDVILRPLEAMRIDYMDLARKVLLKYLQEDLVIIFNAECILRLPNAPPEERKGSLKDPLNSKKRIEIKVLSPSSIQITNNFRVEMHAYSEEVSKIWASLNKKYAKIEQHEFEHIKRNYEAHNSHSFCLDFDSSFYLDYQNVKVPENLKKYVATGNFLYIPSTRSHLLVLGPSFEFLTKITQSLQEAEKSSKAIVVLEHTIEDHKFQLVIMRRDRKPTSKRVRNIHGFSIIFYSGQKEESDASDNEIELELELPAIDLKRGTISTIRKLVINHKLKSKRLSGVSVSDGTDSKLMPQSVQELKETIVSEYFPSESSGLERQLTPSREWIRKFSNKLVKLTPDSMPSFFKALQIDEIVENTATHPKSLFFKKPSRSDDGWDESLKFNASFLDVFEDDEKKLGDWNFNVPKISNVLEKSRLVWFMLEDFGLITDFEINRNILCEFILQIKAGYTQYENPFHNYDHGITVMHSCYYILKYCGFRDNFSSLMNMGILVAAFCHDVGHRGKTNVFEVNSRSDVAITYHDRAVLEQYHAAYTFRVLNKEAYNILANLSVDDYKDVRKVIISCILATDMKEHFDGLKNLKLLTEGLKQMAVAESPHRAKAYSKKKVPAGGEKQPEDSNSLEWSEDDVKVITGMMVHAADLSGPTKNWELEYYFATQVNKEFIKQTEDEKALNIPVTPYMLNLDKPSVMAKAEMQFMKFIIKPLWDTFNDFMGDSLKIASDNLNDNLNKWEEMYDKALKEEVQEAEKEKEEKAEKGEDYDNAKKDENPERAIRKEKKKTTFLTKRQPTIKEEEESTT